MYCRIHTHLNTIFHEQVWWVCVQKAKGGIFTEKITHAGHRGVFAGSQCLSVTPHLHCDDLQLQHSLGICCSLWRISFPQQVKQRPSSERSCPAWHMVHFHMPGPRQPKQDGWHALHLSFSLSDFESWRRKHRLNPRVHTFGQLWQFAAYDRCKINEWFEHKQKHLLNKKKQEICHLWCIVVAYWTLGGTHGSHQRVAKITGLTG